MKKQININNGVLAFILFLTIVSVTKIHAQPLKPGFDPHEYTEALKMAFCTADTPWANPKLIPAEYRMIYRSGITSLDNRWDLWVSNAQIAAISIRGTTGSQVSWLENFYSAMLPASGSIDLPGKNTFTYSLAKNPRAAVHAGWLLATASISKEVIHAIDSCYQLGIHNIIITGHSQGGAIAFLLTAMLRQQQSVGLIPDDIRFKTYCSAAPKPGNLYFAYDYEDMTRGGWAYNVVNSADWVPETPLSIQTMHDFNEVNPFTNASTTIKKQSFATRIIMRHAFNKLTRPVKRSVRNYKKYLGYMAGKFVAGHLKEFNPGEYLNTFNYTRCGETILLMADESYYRNYPNDPDKVFRHHFAGPYLYLMRKYYVESTVTGSE